MPRIVEEIPSSELYAEIVQVPCPPPRAKKARTGPQHSTSSSVVTHAPPPPPQPQISFDSSNPGYKLLLKMGYAGGGLGKREDGLTRAPEVKRRGKEGVGAAGKEVRGGTPDDGDGEMERERKGKGGGGGGVKRRRKMSDREIRQLLRTDLDDETEELLRGTYRKHGSNV